MGALTFHPAQVLGGAGGAQFHAQQVGRVHGVSQVQSAGRARGQGGAGKECGREDPLGELLGLPPGSGVQGPPPPSPADTGQRHRALAPGSSLRESRMHPGEGAVARGQGEASWLRVKRLGLSGLQHHPTRAELALRSPHSAPTHTRQPPAGTVFAPARPGASGCAPRAGWAGDILLPHCQGRPSPLCRLSGSGT